MSGSMTDEQAPGAAGGAAPGSTVPPAPVGGAPPGPGAAPAVDAADGGSAAFPAVASATADPGRWGRVDDDGTVYVRTADGERAVGSWQAGDAREGLAHFARRFADLL